MGMVRRRPQFRLPAPVAATTQPAAIPQPAPAQSTGVAPSMLQQPAKDAQIVFSDGNLLIHADNSSLAAILRQVASNSGMKIEGLGGDERVFGSFGPGAPRDVLADLLAGTAYNQVLLGDLSNGAPRELILSPTTRGGTPAPSPATSGQCQCQRRRRQRSGRGRQRSSTAASSSTRTACRIDATAACRGENAATVV